MPRSTGLPRQWWKLPVHLRLPLQILAVLCISTVGPFLVMRLTYALGFDTATIFYVSVVVALAFTAILIWTESLHALTPLTLPPTPTTSPPVATAIVAAYLPNEADTIVETLSHVLGQDYPGPLQVILAYNSPVDLPVEAELRQLVHDHPELEILKIADSTSKAQNVNAALQVARGEFIGVFDADHHPVPGSFTRAWHWIAEGADVVQGHCVVRNGEESLIARAVSIEFEQIYAVSHPGRSSLHRFGIFGGSNGYWRASTLRRVRMRVDRLTEDIDASIRSILDGASIVSDPGLISRELAPVSLSALWRQRMRWAQGWFQVSMRQFPAAMLSRSVTHRQRMGMFVLFAWREVYPWISPMIIGVLAFLWWRDGSLSWSSPLFLLTTLYTLAAGPIQILFAWRLSVPEIRARRGWFIWYIVVASPFYNEWKNLVARVAQVKELMGEHEWHVTPRGTMRAFVPETDESVALSRSGPTAVTAPAALPDGSLA
ncbi:glycosyltransferase family 2 protein [Gordonia sp. NPDC003425]